MRRPIGLIVAGIAGLGLAGVSLHAEPRSPSNADDTRSRAGDAKSPEDLQRRADGLLAHMTDQLRHMHGLQVHARADRDPLKLGCIDNELVVGNAVLRIAEDERTSLGAAVRASSHVDAAAAHGRIAALAAECDEASRAAGTCVGDKALVAHPPTRVYPVVTHRPHVIDDPTDDCNIMGLQGCQSQSLSLEYVVWASPFSPK